VTTVLRGFVQLQVYVLVCVAPLVFALLGDRPPGREFVVELSVGLGFVGLAVLGLQLVVTTRIKDLAGPYGMDVVIQFHRQMSIVGFAMVLAHPALLITTELYDLSLLNPFARDAQQWFGLAAVVGLLTIVVTSLWRKRLRLGYEVWKVVHGVVAVTVVATALIHVQIVGYYVDTLWKQVLWIAMSAALLSAIGWVRLVKPVLLLRHPWEVVDVVDEGAGSWTLRLRPVGHDGLRFQPGQFAWIVVGGSPFSVEEHPFSFSSSAERGTEEVSFTIKELGDWTSQVSDIEPGRRAYVDGPYGAFSPDRAEGPGFVLVAGGIGITPILSILRTFADRGERRPLLLLYGGSSLDDLAFLDELHALAEQLALEVVPVPQEAPEGWEGESGFVDADMLARHLPDRGLERWQCFVCGPPPMIDAVEEALEGIGVPPDHIHAERFEFA
jgi:predicted ferric reductase